MSPHHRDRRPVLGSVLLPADKGAATQRIQIKAHASAGVIATNPVLNSPAADSFERPSFRIWPFFLNYSTAITHTTTNTSNARIYQNNYTLYLGTGIQIRFFSSQTLSVHFHAKKYINIMKLFVIFERATGKLEFLDHNRTMQLVINVKQFLYQYGTTLAELLFDCIQKTS